MAIQVQGNSGVVAEVDGTGFRALRVTGRPVEYGTLGFYRISMTTGTIGAALAANSEVFQWRWGDVTRFGLVYKVTMSGAGLVAVATAAGPIGFEVVAARAYSVNGTGGTAATLTGNNCKLRTSMGTTLVSDIRCATTVALGGGTKTLDTQGMGAIISGVGTAAVTAYAGDPIIPRTGLLDADGEGQHPLVNAQNEGFMIKTTHVGPAALTYAAGFGVIWAEVAAY